MKCIIKDIPIYYETRGEGQPILMIHGFTPDHRLMLGCMEPLFQPGDGWRRIYFDLPGMGQTPGPAWLATSDQMLEVVLEFVEQVLPQQNYCVAGESYGGYLAQGLIMHQASRIQGLLHLCPMVTADPTQRNVPEHVILEQEPGLLERLSAEERAAYEPMMTVQTAETWQKMKDDILCGLQAADQAFLERLFNTGYGFQREIEPEQMKAYDKPVLILVGRQDSVVGYQNQWKWAACYPHATYAVLDRAGHNLQIEQPGLFAALTLEWLGRVEKGWQR